MQRVVITGMGALSPIGNSVEAFNEGLKAGRSGAALITKFDASNFKTQFACELKDYEVNNHFDRKEARKLDAFTQYAMVAADEAISQAGIHSDSLNKDRIGVIWGSGIGGLRSIEKEIEDFSSGSGIPRYNPFMIPKMIANIASGHISIKYGFTGLNYSTVSACASSTHSIINAFDYIRLGKADIIVCGGSEAAITKVGIGGFSSMKALSSRNDDPATASRPFDASRDGFVLGEGAAALVVESYESAKDRGATILAEIVGTGMTADAYHITAPDPDGHGVIKVMKLALKEAGMNVDDIDYINVHSTATPLGDIAEINAIQKVFSDRAYDINISATKSMTGHLLGAAGALETVASVLAVRDSYIPPTINHFEDDPEIDPKLNLTFNQAQQRKVNAAMCNTFGFGGHNSTVIVKRF